MKQRWTVLILAMTLLLCGCEEPVMEQTEPVLETVVSATVPADGNPDDVTCKGTYTGTAADEVAATSGRVQLTNRQLSAWYWAQVAQYRQENHSAAPDFTQPLEEQVCDIDSSVNSWQQYFLKRALSAWHSAQALIQHSEEVPLTFEEAYQPNLKNIERYMTGMPASEVLYGYHSHYRPNSMHQAYLDEIPRMLEALSREKGYADVQTMAAQSFGASAEELEAFVSSWNRGYMYFTHLTHSIEPTEEEPAAFYEEFGATVSEDSVCGDFRHILLIPGESVFASRKAEQVISEVTVAQDGTVTCAEELWTACEADAQKLLQDWKKNTKGTEATFGEYARKYSKDPGTIVNGGHYQNIRKGQMIKALDEWCFDPARQTGDTAILRSDFGVHIVYFSGSHPTARKEAQEEYLRQQQNALLSEIRDAYPLEVAYNAIVLQEAEGAVASGELLYPDIAHERFPEIPLYLQQDYPTTMYGNFEIRTNGCGITSFAMVASYLTDEEYTPPEMCARYGRYSHHNGTDGMIFNYESSAMGFYLREKTYDSRLAQQALQEGHVVISIQHPGYWTRGGHYIVCESINEEGLVQVRDSNIFNYFNVRDHKVDAHTWKSVTSAGSGYWIFEQKVTRIPACSRCGTPEGLTVRLLQTEYTCEKCGPAILRRNTYLNA